MHDFLTSTSTLENVGKHIGLGDLMLSSVSLNILNLNSLYIAFSLGFSL